MGLFGKNVQPTKVPSYCVKLCEEYVLLARHPDLCERELFCYGKKKKKRFCFWQSTTHIHDGSLPSSHVKLNQKILVQFAIAVQENDGGF